MTNMESSTSEHRNSTDHPPSFHATFNAKNLMYYPKSELKQDPPELKLKREASRESQISQKTLIQSWLDKVFNFWK